MDIPVFTSAKDAFKYHYDYNFNHNESILTPECRVIVTRISDIYKLSGSEVWFNKHNYKDKTYIDDIGRVVKYRSNDKKCFDIYYGKVSEFEFIRICLQLGYTIEEAVRLWGKKPDSGYDVSVKELGKIQIKSCFSLDKEYTVSVKTLESCRKNNYRLMCIWSHDVALENPNDKPYNEYRDNIGNFLNKTYAYNIYEIDVNAILDDSEFKPTVKKDDSYYKFILNPSKCKYCKFF